MAFETPAAYPNHQRNGAKIHNFHRGGGGGGDGLYIIGIHWKAKFEKIGVS